MRRLGRNEATKAEPRNGKRQSGVSDLEQTSCLALGRQRGGSAPARPCQRHRTMRQFLAGPNCTAGSARAARGPGGRARDSTTAASPEPYTTAPGGTGARKPAPAPPSGSRHTKRSVCPVRLEATVTSSTPQVPCSGASSSDASGPSSAAARARAAGRVTRPGCVPAAMEPVPLSGAEVCKAPPQRCNTERCVARRSVFQNMFRSAFQSARVVPTP